MPPRKRTDQSKHTPTTSPTTSTLHGSSDQPQHHHLRHTGPSISTRASVSAAQSKSPLAPTSESPLNEKDTHGKGSLAERPRAPFTKFMYFLLFAVLLLFGWYLYGMITLLETLKEEIGWWGIVTGNSSPEGMMRWSSPGRERGRVEAETGDDLDGSLRALADALGISPIQVASAVKPLIPQASLTSIASQAAETGASEAVKILFEDAERNSKGGAGVTAVVAGEFGGPTGNDATENII